MTFFKSMMPKQPRKRKRYSMNESEYISKMDEERKKE